MSLKVALFTTREISQSLEELSRTILLPEAPAETGGRAVKAVTADLVGVEAQVGTEEEAVHHLQ